VEGGRDTSWEKDRRLGKKKKKRKRREKKIKIEKMNSSCRGDTLQKFERT